MNAGVVAISIALAAGDPLKADDDLHQEWVRDGRHCASSRRGLLLRGTKAVLSPKQSQSGVTCTEHGLDEKNFQIAVNQH